MVHAYFYCFEVAQRRGSEAFSWEHSSDLAILQQPSQAYKSRRRVIAFLSRGLSVHLGERIWASLMVCIQGGLKSRSRAVVVTTLPQYQSRRLQGFQITGHHLFTFPPPQMHMNQTHHTSAMCLDSGKVAPDPCEPDVTHDCPGRSRHG
jgi:hypothetical protein